MTSAEALKARITEVALRFFRERGVRSVTMDDIAHELSISKRTLYQIFADKEDLLIACVKHRERIEEQQIALVKRETQDVLQMLLASFAYKMQEMDRLSEKFEADFSKYVRLRAYIDRRSKEREEEAVAFLNTGKEQGMFRQGVNFHIVYNQITLNVETLTRSGVFQRYSHREIFVNTIVPYIRGCATMKGIEVIDRFMEAHRAADEPPV